MCLSFSKYCLIQKNQIGSIGLFFKDQALSPVGSPFMDFLFSHFEQFTRSMGEEKVLNRIAEAFEIKLRDMIRGREPMDDLDKVAKQMAPHHFNSRERMDTYVALGKALREARKG